MYRVMARYSLCLILFLLPMKVAWSTEIPTIFAYMQQNDMDDEYHQSSLFQRCAGVIGAYAKFIPQSMAQEKEALGNLSIEMLTVGAMLLAEKNMTTASENLRQVQSAFQYFVDQYYRQIERTQLNTGSIFGGSVGEEFKFCQNLYSQ